MKKPYLSIIIFSMVLFTMKLNAQQGACIFDSGKVIQKWKEFGSNPGWTALEKQLKQKGFKQMNQSVFMTGMQTAGKKEFYAYDFYNAEGKPASMIYRYDGKTEYIAYIILGKGSDWSAQLQAGEEYYSDKSGVVKKANSWKSCFRKNATKNCKDWCLKSIPACAAAGVALAFANPAIGVGVFFGCAAGSCLMCFAVIAVGCE